MNCHATSFREFNARICMCFFLGVLLMFLCFCILRPVLTIGPSMVPTLKHGQLLASVPVVGDPTSKVHRGDVVIVRGPDHKTLIKRVIALPNDRLVVLKNRVFVNAQELTEPYLAEPMNNKYVVARILEDDQYFVMGDNRNISADSRHYGTFSGSDIIAVVIMEDALKYRILAFLTLILPIVLIGMGFAYEENRHLTVSRLSLVPDPYCPRALVSIF